MSRLARCRTLRGIASNLETQFPEIDEDVCLSPQLVRNHWRLTGDARQDGDTYATTLHRLDQWAKVTVTREQHHLIDMPGQVHSMDR